MRITPYTYTQPSPPLPSPRHATPRRSKVPFIYGIVSPLGPSLHLIYPKQTDGSTNVSAIPPGRYWGSAFTSVPQKGSPPKKKNPSPKTFPTLTSFLSFLLSSTMTTLLNFPLGISEATAGGGGGRGGRRSTMRKEREGEARRGEARPGGFTLRFGPPRPASPVTSPHLLLLPLLSATATATAITTAAITTWVVNRLLDYQLLPYHGTHQWVNDVAHDCPQPVLFCFSCLRCYVY